MAKKTSVIAGVYVYNIFSILHVENTKMMSAHPFTKSSHGWRVLTHLHVSIGVDQMQMIGSSGPAFVSTLSVLLTRDGSGGQGGATIACQIDINVLRGEG